MTALALAQGYRQLQLDQRRQLVRDVTVAWAALDHKRLSASWPTWMQLMVALLRRYHAAAVDSAALYYRADRQRHTGQVADPGLIVRADEPSEEWIARALGYAAAGTFDRHTTAGMDPQLAERHALTQVIGTASRISLDGGRSTLVNTAQADERAVGYYRVTDGDPCAFCALMASRVVFKNNRGRFYTSAANAGADRKWHNDCGCTVAVAFTRDVDLQETSVLADAIYRDGNGSLADFRKAWNEHLANKRPAA